MNAGLQRSLVALALFSMAAGAARADAFLRVRPPEGGRLDDRPRRGQREVLHRRGQFVDMVATPQLRRELIREGFRVEVLQQDIRAAMDEMARADGGRWRRHAEVLAEMHSWQRRRPDLVELHEVGNGAEVLPGGGQRAILVARIGGEPGEERPRVLLFGGVHARELATTEALLDLGRTLTEGEDRDPALASLLRRREVWILPALNPDGREYCFREDPWWRKNRNTHRAPFVGVDLNRNFGYRWGPNPPRGGSSGLPASGIYRGPRPFSEPESQALRDLVLDVGFDASLSLHAYGEMVLLPFGYDGSAPAHQAMYDELAGRLAAATRYTVGRVQEVLGYYSNGRHDDWLYADRSLGKRVVAAAELEVGKSFFPSREGVREISDLVQDAALRVAAMAGADLEVVVRPGPGSGRTRELLVTVVNRGLRPAREVVVEVLRAGEGPGWPLVRRDVGSLPGLADPGLDGPARRDLRVRLLSPPRRVRAVVTAAGEEPQVAELVLPEVAD